MMHVALGIAGGLLRARVGLYQRCAEALGSETPYSEDRHGLPLRAAQLLLASWVVRTRRYVEADKAGDFLRLLFTQVLREDAEEGAATADSLAREPGMVARLHRLFTGLATEIGGRPDPARGWYLLFRFGASFWTSRSSP